MFSQKKAVLLPAILIIAAAAVLLFSGLSGGSAEAAKGGRGGGKTVAPTATLTVSPNPVPAWGAIYSVTGSGFNAGSAVNFVLNGGVVTYARADAYGVAGTTFQSGAPGTSKIDAYQYNGKSWVLVGSIIFSVV